ncbi:nitroreductase [Altererythrobacter atlanticus]|uniref:Putative NADH dehydrogenase/NAD(P)H nitroreductase WYH_01215 n=1 Tax=Croceibacterium atlanticum TaxID=1267766 RepID=A0A0F7KTZ8_9SPHN|nr:malonic semialdehyde reductase [Croceibacterium atlanticum]AKH42260.1 putative malonic semialdehyde reductase RutE [Croceibacterium atlanticum]MBB5731036.1 nitroreductase [Croceibacterium atlanticum]
MSDPLGAEALDQIFREARTVNEWQDREVSDAQIHEIWELAKMGPTSANQLPARLVWCKSQESRERLAAHAAEGNRHKILTAPVCVIVAMDEDFHEQLPWLFPHTDAKSWFEGDEEGRKVSAFRNGTLQGAYLILAARALGLDCGPMSGFDNAAVDKDFFADEPKWKSNFICSIGYGDRTGLFPRSPRPDFDVFNRLL